MGLRRFERLWDVIALQVKILSSFDLNRAFGGWYNIRIM